MSSNSKNQKNRQGQKAPTPSKTTIGDAKTTGQKASAKPQQKDTWSKLDSYLSRHLNVVLWISVLFSILFGAFLFDVKISTGGDDSHYIEMANDFLKGRAFPSWHGPLYPVFLSLPMLFLGVKVIWLKLFSFVFIIAHLVLFFYTFRRHVTPTLFTLVMLIIAVNSTILYFASQTYSEAMFMFLQSLIIFLFINVYLNYGSSTATSLKEEVLQWFILGFFVFLASLTRNIGIVALLAMVLFLLYEKKFRAAVMLVLSYVVFLIPFRIYKSVVWDAGISKGPDQISEILRKNPYNRAMGTEDFAGMVDRFLLNAKGYLSKHFMIGLGLHDPASTYKSWFVTILIVVLFLIALYFAFRRSKIMLFIAIYLGGSISATFIALNQSWDQMRMVIIYVPMLLLLLTWGIQQLSSQKGLSSLAIILPFLLVFIFFKTFGQTMDKVKINQKVLSKNMTGNLYYGFTPDWQNFLRMSEWVGKNIPENELVASRKPSMSYIYSKGREFYGMYRFPTEAPEEFLGKLRRRTGELMVFPNKDIRRDWPADLQWAIKRSNVACVAEGSDVYGVYEFKGQAGNETVQALNEYQVHPFSADSLLNRIRRSGKSCFAVSPDSLLNTLHRNEVNYVIVANLRANPNMKTDNIINNIQRYLFFVEQKYPGILKLVHQVGADADEPAWLYQIDYKIYGL
jgi:hypothetical protein